MAKKVDKKVVNTKYSQLARNAYSKVSSVFRNDESINLLNQLKAGDTRIMKYDRVENTIYDPRWIEEIEDCLYDLGLIVQNPKRVTQEVTDVVPVELARKTNAQSVIHLATHSQYVKEMKENGDIVPNNILNIGSDDFLQTYENRFIATLIRRLILFVEKRYQFLEENVNVKKTQVLMMKNKSIIDGREVEIETKVKISADDIIDDEQINLNKSYISRVKELKRYLLYYYNSQFMKEMHTEKNVRNPILMTNIIRKNPLYNHCYRLYRFIDKYDLMGVEYKVNEKYDAFDEKKLNEINKAFLLSFLSVGPDETIRKVKRTKKRVYKPHIESNTDDDIFFFGPYYKGPLEFVRADEEFRKYLENSKYIVPPHLTKREKEYWGEEISENKATMEEMLEVAKLLRRKNKEFKLANKEFDRIENERLKEEALAQARKELQKENNILNDFEKARQELILSALKANGGGIIPSVEKTEEAPKEVKIKQEREILGYDNVKEAKPLKIKANKFVPFSKRIENSEKSLSDAYKEIRHEALCYGLKSRISRTSDTFRLHNMTYIKIAQASKSLKIHYALNPKSYEQSPIHVKDDGNKVSYAQIPLLFKVRSKLSVKRAISLIHDLAAKYGLEYKEIISEEEKLATVTEEPKAKETVEVKDAIVFKRHEFVPFIKRIENADPALADAYKTIRHQALCYGLKSRISKKSDTFRLHNVTYLKIAQFAKSLKIHYALDPKAYENTALPIKDDCALTSYKEIPLLFKVRSNLSIKRAVSLVNDLAKKYGLIYNENNLKATEKPEKIIEKIIEKEIPVNNENVSANFKKNEFVPFKQRIIRSEKAVREAYKALKEKAKELGLQSRISKSGDTFRFHQDRVIKVAVVGKSLKIHFALDPKDYKNSTIPVIDDSKHSSYVDIPLVIKVRSPLSGRRALLLLEDLANELNLGKETDK